MEANSGAGPTLSDTKALFHVDHGNKAATGAVISDTTLSAARLALRTQKGLDGRIIRVTPKNLLVPPALETVAEKWLATIAPATLPPEVSAAIVNPTAYGEWNGIKETFRWARDNMPVGLVQAEGYMPFWAITRHEDIMTVSKDNQRFLNAPKSVVLGPVAV